MSRWADSAKPPAGQGGVLPGAARGVERTLTARLVDEVRARDGRLRQRTGILRSVFPALPDDIGDGVFGDTSEAVTALAVSPDGSTLAVGGEAGSLQLWDIATQQPLGSPLTTSGEQIDTVAFSADGGTVYAGSPHVPLQRYPIDPTRAVGAVCARAGGDGLTRAQWQTYLPGVAYRKVCG